MPELRGDRRRRHRVVAGDHHRPDPGPPGLGAPPPAPPAAAGRSSRRGRAKTSSCSTSSVELHRSGVARSGSGRPTPASGALRRPAPRRRAGSPPAVAAVSSTVRRSDPLVGRSGSRRTSGAPLARTAAPARSRVGLGGAHELALGGERDLADARGSGARAPPRRPRPCARRPPARPRWGRRGPSSGLPPGPALRCSRSISGRQGPPDLLRQEADRRPGGRPAAHSPEGSYPVPGQLDPAARRHDDAHRHLVPGQGPGLVGADRRGRPERLDGRTACG